METAALERRRKQRLVRQLVDENVQLIEGRLPEPPRRVALGMREILRGIALAMVPVAMLTASLAITWADEPVFLSPPVIPVEPAVPVARAAELSGSTFGPSAEALATAVPGEVFPLAVRRVVIDPGHGGENTGTRADGLEEKFLTLDISERLARLLEEDGFEVLMTREDDRAVSLRERAAFANAERADIFLSIHVNWLEGSRRGGVETYFLGATDDPFVTRLANQENRESGHTMAELRSLLEGIYAGVRQDQSRQLAESIQGDLFRALRRVNPQLTDRGVKTAPFLVLVHTDMPAILAEVAALSDASEAAMLAKPLYRQYIAEALAEGLRSYGEGLEGRSPTGAPWPVPEERVARESLARESLSREQGAQEQLTQEPPARDPSGEGSPVQGSPAQGPSVQGSLVQDPPAQDPPAQDPPAQDQVARDQLARGRLTGR